MGHRQMGVRGFSVSSPEAETRMPPMVMGKIHDQQISVMGLTKRPTQLAWTGAQKSNKSKRINNNDFSPRLDKAMINLFALLVSITVVLAIILKRLPSVPEPECPIKTPFGKLRFFDGVILYGFFILILLALVSWILCSDLLHR